MNPLFPDESGKTDDPQGGPGYVLPRSGRQVEPPKHRSGEPDNPAVELIRHKIDALYAHEPDARQEVKEAQGAGLPRTKHQQFMYQLSTSGKSLAEIQTDWHNYYVRLSDDEKHEVWQEFYEANSRAPSAYTKYVREKAAEQAAPAEDQPQHSQEQVQRQGIVVSHHKIEDTPPADHRNMATAKKRALRKVRLSQAAQQKAKRHFQSLLFGIGTGCLVLLIFLFGFFNEVFITPFIQPNNHTSDTPIILSTDGIAPSQDPEVIVPKINVELPVVYGTSSINENDVQTALEKGVFHYPTTALPGQQGNAAFFGHSSNNIFNKGQYKFAFVLLHTLEPGDIFYLAHQGKLYTYKVFKKQIVEPTDTWVLNSVEGHAATATLITCDPPGTTRHRLVVWADQVNPDPTGNATGTPPAVTTQPEKLTDNGPSAWSRFWHWVTPW